MSRWKKLTGEERLDKKARRHEHLRQIKGLYVHRELFHGPFFHAGDEALDRFLSMLESKESAILVAANNRHAKKIESQGYKAVWQVDRPVPADDVMLGRVFRKPDAQGDLGRMKFTQPLAGAFVCERLQKQPNLFNYLVSLRNAVVEEGPVALVVPNAHHELVDDHINLFTAGTLIYNLVRAGWDCSQANVWFDKRFINITMRRQDTPEPYPQTVDQINVYTPFRNVFNYCSSEFPEVYRDETP